MKVNGYRVEWKMEVGEEECGRICEVFYATYHVRYTSTYHSKL